MKNEIENIRKNLELLEKFDGEFPELREGDPLVCIGAYGDLRIIFQCNDKLREGKLAAIGKILGRDGWTTREEGSGKYLNWMKTVLDVEIEIQYAQPLDRPPVGFPVPPESFPLMLENLGDAE